ncbi:D-3-phosphoglycerate dehydrogenase OS=Castellaniella defragrans (strain DSM / CCUG 39792 / 65Phen)OX=1437824 GN=BN940_07521 PE=4 SV=1 [Castellaniella denitrificans]|uniref:2-hydroxyacid dehydrogenase n=1 Tax=Castellaniella sp. TaxID=1955812 RepID=UPI002AFE9E08|nr:glyoxylate/hydroxypyruvate reductase A [Castellaniella sp.]
MDIVFASELEADPQAWVAALRDALPEARVRLWGDGEPEGRAEFAVVWAPPADLFTREPRLRALFNLGAGVDALLRLPGLPDGLPLVRLEDGGMAVQMAEYALYHLLRESRDFGRYERQQAEGLWRPLDDIDRDAWTVGVLGAGAMGARVAQACAALEYPTAVWSRSGRAVPGAESYGGEAGLAAFLARTRVLVNALPLTDATRGILCRRTFDQLRPDAVVINIARGGHLVESDLLAALDGGRVRAAALDVFEREPLPPGHPFWTDARIRVTPHVAGASLMDRTVRQIAGKIRALDRGEAITGIVDRDRQY